MPSLQAPLDNAVPAREKRSVALASVAAAALLTVMKATVAILTGSLGVLSEAAHSALDLLAAALTYFSVRVSDKPADSSHHFGHGKVEPLSAFVETGLLLVTCALIVAEAARRPLKRIGKPEEIAQAALYLASDASAFVTGASLVMDGGGLA